MTYEQLEQAVNAVLPISMVPFAVPGVIPATQKPAKLQVTVFHDGSRWNAKIQWLKDDDTLAVQQTSITGNTARKILNTLQQSPELSRRSHSSDNRAYLEMKFHHSVNPKLYPGRGEYYITSANGMVGLYLNTYDLGDEWENTNS